MADSIPGVKRVIAVGAGKGGVGKSTLALLLAFGLQRRGRRAGLLDADVYGPSIPKMTGTETAQPYGDAEGRVIPPERDGVRILSMGYLVPPDQAVIWRGPMAQKYVKEFLDRGAWGELDYLIVDLPPGTGDIPLTLAQSIPLTGAVVVCTPQDVALLDAVKALRMYQKLGVEPLGLVENMSYYLCPQCGHREHIFDHGGCERAAGELGVPFLGAIPLNIAIRKSGDAGRPCDYFSRETPLVADAIEQVVQRVEEEVERRANQGRPAPRLTVRG
jgi:ATP-binding protein involved in chromosome partitioning